MNDADLSQLFGLDNDDLENLGIDLNNFNKEEEIKFFSGFKPTGWHIFVRLYIPALNIMSMSKGKIIDPFAKTRQKELQFKNCVGLVISMGSGAYKDERYSSTGKWCEVGDWVVFPRHAGWWVKYRDKPIFVLNDDSPGGIVDDPTLIDRG